MVFTQEYIATGLQLRTSFEHNGKSYIADVCLPLDHPHFGAECFIGEVGEDGYLVLGNTVCVEVDEVSKQCLETVCNDFIAGNMNKYVTV